MPYFFGKWNKNFYYLNGHDNLKFIKVLKNVTFKTEIIKDFVDIQLFTSNDKEYYIDFER